MSTTLLLLALAGAVVYAVIGTLWYSSGTPMGRLHMRVLGFDTLSPEEQARKIAEAKPMMWKLYMGQILLSFLTSLSVVFIMTMSMQNGVTPSMAAGFIFANWLCFTVPAVGSQILWSNTDRALMGKKFVSDILSHLVTMLVIAYLTVLVA